MDTTDYSNLASTIGTQEGVSPSLLLAIQKQENPNGDPKAVNKNSDGSIDRGIMQINSNTYSDLVKRGVVPANLDLNNPSDNMLVAARLISHDILPKTGSTNIAAIGTRYNGSPEYGQRLVKTYQGVTGGSVPDNPMVQVPQQVINTANTDANNADQLRQSMDSEKQAVTGSTNDLITAVTGKAQADATVNQEKNASINETVGMTQRAATALGTNMQGNTQNIVEALGPQLAIARQNLNDALTARNQGDAKTFTSDPLGWLVNNLYGHDHNQQQVQNYAQTADAYANEIRSANELTQSQNITNAAVTAGISAKRDQAEGQSLLQGAQVAAAEANIKAATGRSEIDAGELGALRQHLEATTLPTQLQIQAQNASYFGAMRQAIMQNKQLQTQDIQTMNQNLLGVGTALGMPGLNITKYKNSSPEVRRLIESYQNTHQFGPTPLQAVTNSKYVDSSVFTPAMGQLRDQLQQDASLIAKQVSGTAVDKKQIPDLINQKLQEKYGQQLAYPENGNTIYRISPHAMLNEQGLDWSSPVGKVISPLLQATQGQQLDSDSILQGVQGGVKAGLYTNQQAGQFLSQMYGKAIQYNNSSFKYKLQALPELQKYNIAGTLGYNAFGNRQTADVDMTNAASVSNFLLKKAISDSARNTMATNPIAEFQR